MSRRKLRLLCVELEARAECAERLAAEYLSDLNSETARRVAADLEMEQLRADTKRKERLWLA